MSIPNCRSSENVPCPIALRTSLYIPTNTSAIRFRIGMPCRCLPGSQTPLRQSIGILEFEWREKTFEVAECADRPDGDGANDCKAKSTRSAGPGALSLAIHSTLMDWFNYSYSESFLPPSMKNWTVRAIPGFCRGDSFGACGGTFLKYFFLTITPLKAGVFPTAPMPYRLSTLIF